MRLAAQMMTEQSKRRSNTSNLSQGDIQFTLEAADLLHLKRAQLNEKDVRPASTDDDPNVGVWRIRLLERILRIQSPRGQIDVELRLIGPIEQLPGGAWIEIGQHRVWLPARAFNTRSDFERFVSRMISTATHARDQSHCPNCDYDLGDRTNAGCPECGWRRAETVD